ncbi:MAG TPA: FAD-dependent oxidoreductase, partial [Thermoanaerobaculia bacterium]|nr:FAD-dependent oxidoreductase [Thermoanaerobaculia bacterium]
VETGALWMHRGDDAYVRSSVPVMRDLGFPMEKLDAAAARKRWPQIQFDGVQSIWIEHRAGALSARRACVVVRDEFVKAGGTYRVAAATPGPIASESMKSIILGDGTKIEADAFVFACGPWLGSVFPDVVGARVRPTRQEVYYFGTPRGSDAYAPPNLPVWIDFGERIFYGIPDTHERGFKLADDTRGDAIDPTTADRRPTPESIARARNLLTERFPEIANAPLVHAEVCQYENTPDGHLLVDRHPAAQNVWLAGGGSGHGYKLSPALGEMVAGAVLSGTALPSTFRLDREAAKPSTQFERK